jgi:hypothetical protein
MAKHAGICPSHTSAVVTCREAVQVLAQTENQSPYRGLRVGGRSHECRRRKRRTAPKA